jgi:hypothetical protein
MSDSPEQPPSTNPVEYHQPPRPSVLARIARVVGMAVAAFAGMFVPIFFAGASGFEKTNSVWWAWPVTGAVALLLAGAALRMRKTRPHASAGVWIGIGLGLLWAGMCFNGM